MTEPTGTPTELSPVKQALLEIRRLKAQVAELQAKRSEPVAVIGMGLRFPGADDPQAFWSLLANGVDAVQEVPPDRWDLASFYSPEPQAPGKMNTRWGAFLADIDQFDARFFGISPREAASMDPQQRLLLETAWEALERAGLAPDALFGSQTGVFLGMSNSDYYRMLLSDIHGIDAYTTTGGTLSVAGGRLSYTLGLHGPNLIVDTACSSSLVAIHLACSSLRSGESSLALAAGVNLILSPELNINFSIASMLAPDGRCKAFDQAADGYVRGEGCAVLVLKLLSQAVQDGDPILAVIRGTAANHDGRSGGLTAPNGPAQTNVIRAALQDGGVSPQEISYVEAHGTGTSLGDPIEIGALVEALCQRRGPDWPLHVGSVKTNIGHLEAAAGIASAIKVILSLQHRQIPPHLHFKTINPHIVLDGAPIFFPTGAIDWQPGVGGRRLAGVSSFGLSGTNAHIILEEAPEHPADSGSTLAAGIGERVLQEEQALREERALHLLSLSAKSQPALKAQAARLAAHLESSPELRFTDACFSANTGRAQFSHRLAVVGRGREDALRNLHAWQDGQAENGVVQGVARASTTPEVTFLFTGQGANYPGMGRRLYEDQPVFRAVIDTCDRLLRPLHERPLMERPILDHPLLSALYPKSAEESELLGDMRYAQPALFALQMALAELWKSWGIQPTFVAGHSLGEYAAACLAGVFSLEDGLKLVAGRGRLMQSITRKGQMWAVFAPAEQVTSAAAAADGQVSIAAFNGPANTVISGEGAALEAVLGQFEAQNIKIRRLAISQASHSPLIEPVLNEFGRLAESIQYAAPRLSLVSTLTGQLVQAEEIAQPSYWPRHLRQPVQFAKAMSVLQSHQQHIFVEIGPHPVLVSMGRQCLPDDGNLWLPSLRENQEEWQVMLESLAALWAAGAKVDWQGFDSPYQRKRVPLPTYAFERSRYWADQVGSSSAPTPASSTYEVSVRSASRQSQEGPLDLVLPTYAGRWDVLERLTLAYTIRAFNQLAALTRPEDCWSVDDLLVRTGILPVYRSLMERWLDRLAEASLLKRQGDRFNAPAPLSQPDLAPLLAEAREKLSDSPKVIEYVERCGERLAGVLTGKHSSLDTLFPDGSDHLALGLYQDWALSRYYGMLVRSAVEGALQALPAGNPSIRILEVGAGTGATTSHILPVLPAGRASYFFTDVSGLFLSRAEEKFRAYPFVQYGILDIEKSPQEQGYAAHSFDLVVATNVLHAVPSLEGAVRNSLSLLAPGGLLVLNEVTTHLAWFDITTGLIEGWQSFKDDLRSKSPLLSSAQWLKLLQDSGFQQVSAWPEEGAPAAVLGQHVIVAQAPLDGPAAIDAFSPAPAVQEAAGLSHSGTALDQASTWMAQFREALPGQRQDMMLAFVRQRLARVLRLPGSEGLEREQRLMDLGLDSLMALELRKQICEGLGLPESALSVTLAFDYPSILALSTYLVDEVGKQIEQGGMTAPEVAPVIAVSSRAAELADLTDEEVEALLIQKLNRRGP